MNKRLKRIGVLKSGVVLAVLYAFFGLLLIPVFLVGGFAAKAAAQQGGTDFPFGFLFGIGALFVPVLYGFFGFVIGIISALLYNLVAKMTGGLEFTFEDIA